MLCQTASATCTAGASKVHARLRSSDSSAKHAGRRGLVCQANASDKYAPSFSASAERPASWRVALADLSTRPLNRPTRSMHSTLPASRSKIPQVGSKWVQTAKSKHLRALAGALFAPTTRPACREQSAVPQAQGTGVQRRGAMAAAVLSAVAIAGPSEANSKIDRKEDLQPMQAFRTTASGLQVLDVRCEPACCQVWCRARGGSSGT